MVLTDSWDFSLSQSNILLYYSNISFAFHGTLSALEYLFQNSESQTLFLCFWPERKISSGIIYSLQNNGWKKLFAWWTAVFYWPSVKMNFASAILTVTAYFIKLSSFFRFHYWSSFIHGAYICEHCLGFLHIVFTISLPFVCFNCNSVSIKSVNWQSTDDDCLPSQDC